MDNQHFNASLLSVQKKVWYGAPIVPLAANSNHKRALLRSSTGDTTPRTHHDVVTLLSSTKCHRSKMYTLDKDSYKHLLVGQL